MHVNIACKAYISYKDQDMTSSIRLLVNLNTNTHCEDKDIQVERNRNPQCITVNTDIRTNHVYELMALHVIINHILTDS